MLSGLLVGLLVAGCQHGFFAGSKARCVESECHEAHQLLIFASYQGNTGEVSRLLPTVKDVNAPFGPAGRHYFPHVARCGWTALHAAAWAGHKEVVALLLAAGATPNVDDGCGGTPLAYAVDLAATDQNSDHPYEAIALLLLGKGANPNTVTQPCLDGFAYSPIHKAIMRPELLRALIRAGADLNMKTEGGGTALHQACWWGSLESVTILLEAGAPVNAKADNGVTPYDCATPGSEIEKVLLEHGANGTPRPPLSADDE